MFEHFLNQWLTHTLLIGVYGLAGAFIFPLAFWPFSLDGLKGIDENGAEFHPKIGVIQVFWRVNKPGGEEIKQ